MEGKVWDQEMRKGRRQEQLNTQRKCGIYSNKCVVVILMVTFLVFLQWVELPLENPGSMDDDRNAKNVPV